MRKGRSAARLGWKRPSHSQEPVADGNIERGVERRDAKGRGEREPDEHHGEHSRIVTESMSEVSRTINAKGAVDLEVTVRVGSAPWLSSLYSLSPPIPAPRGPWFLVGGRHGGTRTLGGSAYKHGRGKGNECAPEEKRMFGPRRVRPC
jgi:hypothetical protein